MTEPIVVQAPASGSPAQLFLLFHGVGATAEGLVPLGRFIGEAFPQAAVVSVPSPFASDLGAGRQWFSVRGVTEANRAARIAQVTPLFAETVRGLQQRFGVTPEATTLVGFSQGAIMALEAARLGQAPAGRIVSIAGRFAELPQHSPQRTTLHLLHGESDNVIPYEHAVAAADRLAQLGGEVTLDVVPAAGHGITQPMAELLVQRLASRAGRADSRA